MWLFPRPFPGFPSLLLRFPLLSSSSSSLPPPVFQSGSLKITEKSGSKKPLDFAPWEPPWGKSLENKAPGIESWFLELGKPGKNTVGISLGMSQLRAGDSWKIPPGNPKDGRDTGAFSGGRFQGIHGSHLPAAAQPPASHPSFPGGLPGVPRYP